MMTDIIYKEEGFTIQGVVFDVYKEMGSGFLEAVYQECMEIEFRSRGIPFETQKELTLFYKGKELKRSYIPDFICFEKIIVELKALKETTNEHKAQVFNYLKAANMRLGLLVNFGHYPKATIERIII
ncbi:MAG TPA: GxxExxY protein [Desulfobacteraceae bacterium]|nr:GxxExxY protein [Desulfobacteraceae bacterium]HPJ68210.1 GxxExxY protein [Desulfobacteraceae bacterium]HPQ28862.1 GxxExxY protein [Desulfobacteraceae bacterium]